MAGLSITVILFANYAVVCFDRMIHSLSIIVACKYSAVPSVIQTRNLVTDKTKHHIKNQHEVFKSNYTQEPSSVDLIGEVKEKRLQHVYWASNPRDYQELTQLCTMEYLLSVNEKFKIEKNNNAFVNDYCGVSYMHRKTYEDSKQITNTI